MAAKHSNARRLIVCVDDFGISRAVDDSIRALGCAGRISATSVLVDGPFWAEDGARLINETDGAIDIGLHLNLTEPFVGGPARPSWGRLVLQCYAGRLEAKALRAEIDRQLDAFEQVARRAPDFVDGHRHVHQLPLVRQALVHALEQRYPPGLPWLRSTAPGAGSLGPATGLKAAVIHALGGRALDGLATAAGLQQNRRLLGVYGFHGDAQAHERRLASWLSASKDGDLLMCHTALPAHAESGDPIALARKVEHQVLSGERFKRLLDDFHILVTRFERAC